MRRLGFGSPLLVAILLLPLAQAQDVLAVDTMAPVTLDAQLDAILHDGFVTVTLGSSQAAVIDHATGKLVLYSWNMTGNSELGYVPTADAWEEQTYVLQDATIRLEGTMGWAAQVSGSGTLTLGGAAHGTGIPSRLTADVAERTAPSPFREPDGVDVAWHAGWAWLGVLKGVNAFPDLRDATATIAGPTKMHVSGATARFVDAQGLPHRVEIHAVPLPGDGPALRMLAFHRAVFIGTTARSVFPLGTDWTASSATIPFIADGQVHWARASGQATRGGRTTTFRDTSVSLDYVGDLTSTVDPSHARQETASGEFRELTIDTQTLAAPRATPTPSRATTVASVTLAALLLLLLTKTAQAILASGLASLYTRLDPSELLAHPVRKRMHDLVTASPGIHTRELHRQLGGAWGPFSFHLRMLEKAGFLRRTKQGGFTLVYATSAGVMPPAIPNPLARAIYDALPDDGSVRDLTSLIATVGASRPLVAYHLRSLEARGLVRRVALDGSHKGIARILATA